MECHNQETRDPRAASTPGTKNKLRTKWLNVFVIPLHARKTKGHKFRSLLSVAVVLKVTNQHMFLDEGCYISLQIVLPYQLRTNVLAMAFGGFHVCATGIVVAGPDSLTKTTRLHRLR